MSLSATRSHAKARKAAVNYIALDPSRRLWRGRFQGKGFVFGFNRAIAIRMLAGRINKH